MLAFDCSPPKRTRLAVYQPSDVITTNEVLQRDVIPPQSVMLAADGSQQANAVSSRPGLPSVHDMLMLPTGDLALNQGRYQATELTEDSGELDNCFTGGNENDAYIGLRTQATDELKEFRNDIGQFFEKSWIVFPVLSHDSLYRRLSMQPTLTSDPSLHTLLLSIRMINQVCEYRIAAANMTSVLASVQDVERSRLEYDFAEPPTLDDVMVSLFLFVAYNVLEKHTRAYLYLDEAFSLLELVETSEVQRRKLIEQVLFNTETATAAVYPRPGRKRRGRKPMGSLNIIPVSSSQDGSITEHERLALSLLTRLTEIHSGDDNALLEKDLSNSSDLRALWSVSLEQRQYCRIQAADVALSQQWRLSTELVAGLKSRAVTTQAAKARAEKLGVSAMAWICSLREGELRIVGLGKIAGMLQSIRTISNNSGCDAVVNGLTGALMKEDHERNFAAGIVSFITASTAPSRSLGRCYVEPQSDYTQIAPDESFCEVDSSSPTWWGTSWSAELEAEPAFETSYILGEIDETEHKDGDAWVTAVLQEQDAL